jgi:hypothetical protein
MSGITQEEIDIARERGRLMAARKVAEDPDARKRVEDTYGIPYCKRRYPEAYRSGFLRLMDRIRPFW